MKKNNLTSGQIQTLRAVAEKRPAADGFAYGPFGRSGHSLVAKSLLESRPGYQEGWTWGFKLTATGRAALTATE